MGAARGGAPAARVVELNEAPSARESDGVVPGSENHDNFSHFLDGADEHLLPPGGGPVECRVLRGGDQIQPHDGVPAAGLEKKKTAKRLWRSILAQKSMRSGLRLPITRRSCKNVYFQAWLKNQEGWPMRWSPIA